MTKITINAEMAAKLHHLTGPTELCVESGKTFGYFHPVSADREPRISEEEIDRRLHQGGGRPLAEILADLEKRA